MEKSRFFNRTVSVHDRGFDNADIINDCGFAKRDVIGPARLYYQSATLNDASTHNLKALLDLVGLTRYDTDDFGTSNRHLDF